VINEKRRAKKTFGRFINTDENVTKSKQSNRFRKKRLKECIVLKKIKLLYRVIINYCPIAVGVENPHKFWMCQPRNVRQISTTASSATYRRYKSHSCYEACGTFNYVTNANCDGTIIYNDNDPVEKSRKIFLKH
jgi:hypothetical protein